MKSLLATATALLLLSNSWSQHVDDMNLPRWAPIGLPIFLLVANPAVQDELRPSVKQRTEIAALVRDAKEIYRGWSKLDWNVRDQKTITEQTMTSNRLGKILKEEQLKRLEQIDNQRRGPVIICDHRASAPLKLSGEQRRKLEILAERTVMASDELSAQLASTAPEDILRRSKIAEQLIKLHSDGSVKVEAELTDEQKKEWRSIRGKPFDLRLLLQNRPVAFD
jgi:hypothetical protein